MKLEIIDKAVVGYRYEENIIIPDGVTSIGDYAFELCKNLKSITIPEGVTSIGDFAFRGCINLTKINIPDSVTSIGWCAFAFCTSLESITIPNSVTSIAFRAFEGHDFGLTVYCNAGSYAEEYCRKNYIDYEVIE